jgi:hypothetical protein
VWIPACENGPIPKIPPCLSCSFWCETLSKSSFYQLNWCNNTATDYNVCSRDASSNLKREERLSVTICILSISCFFFWNPSLWTASSCHWVTSPSHAYSTIYYHSKQVLMSQVIKPAKSSTFSVRQICKTFVQQRIL